MTVTKDQVLERLAQIPGPDGTPLPATGALSDIVANDGKVFFSINVDAAAVQAWEPVRKRAEEIVRAITGVQTAMVALTAERRGGGAPQQAAGQAQRARTAHHGEQPTGVPGVASIIAVASGKGGVGKS